MPELSPDDQALYDRYVAAVEVPDERLRALAKGRAERVCALLQAKGVAAAGLAIGEPNSAGAPAVVIGFKAG